MVFWDLESNYRGFLILPMGENTDRDEGRGVEVDRESHEGTVENDEGVPHFIVENLNNILVIRFTIQNLTKVC